MPQYEYLPAATNFDDIPVKENPDPGNKYYVPCPKCQAHGYWNLRLNAYGEGKHFQALCAQCNGSGYVGMDTIDAKCIHRYRPMTEKELLENNIILGRCEHMWICLECGRKKRIDSSD